MFHRWRSLVTALAALALVLPATAHAAEQTYVSIAGDANAIDGVARLYTAADSSITMFSGTDGGGLEAARVDVQRGDQNWELWFVAPDGRPLAPGVYDDAIDPAGSSFGPGRNGISVSGEGQGCSSTGRFEVKDIAADADGNVGRLWLVYEKHCDVNPFGVFGEIKYREPAPATGATAEPSILRWTASDLGYTRTAAPITVRAASALRVIGTSITGPQAGDFRVHQDGCTSNSLAAGATCQVRVAFAPSAPGTRTATLRVADDAGRTLDVPLQGFSYGGRTEYEFTGGPAGDGATLRYTTHDSVLVGMGDPRDVLFTQAGGDNSNWNGHFVPGKGDTLRPGTYSGVKRYPFNGDAPGLDVNGRGTGCNTVSGSFDVSDATYDRYNLLKTFAVSFVQNCNEDTAHQWRGSFAFRAGDMTPPAPWMRGGAPVPGSTTIAGGGTPAPGAKSSPAAQDLSTAAASAERARRSRLLARLRAALTARRRLVLSLPAGRLRVSWRAHGRVLARGARTWRRAGRRAVVLRLTPAGRRALRRRHRIRATVIASFRPEVAPRGVLVARRAVTVH